MRVGSLAAVVVALLVAACGSGESGKTIELSQKDSGTTLQVTQGDELVISLESNPTTGYSWAESKSSQASDVLQLVSKKYESESDAIGAGGIETWTYKAVGAGTANLELDYLRPFEPDNIVGKFVLTVNVKR